MLFNIAFLLVLLIKNVLNKQFQCKIGDLTSLNRPVTCPVIKNFDRTKGKIWPDNVRWPALICRPVKELRYPATKSDLFHIVCFYNRKKFSVQWIFSTLPTSVQVREDFLSTCYGGRRGIVKDLDSL